MQTCFCHATRYFGELLQHARDLTPACADSVAIFALRTLKWPLAVGLDAQGLVLARQVGSDVNGTCGVAQFALHSVVPRTRL
jgi:hypothetical protein